MLCWYWAQSQCPSQSYICFLKLPKTRLLSSLKDSNDIVKSMLLKRFTHATKSNGSATNRRRSNHWSQKNYCLALGWHRQTCKWFNETRCHTLLDRRLVKSRKTQGLLPCFRMCGLIIWVVRKSISIFHLIFAFVLFVSFIFHFAF